ncbi:MFS transporter [Dactylosporangium cerinum]
MSTAELTTDPQTHRDPSPWRRMRVWATAHAVDDFYQGLVPAAVPYFVLDRHYGYVGAAGLAMAAALGSSLPQLVFGVIADRRRLPWMSPVGVALAGTGAGLAGVAPTYPLVWTLLLLSGLGVAMFHPAAGRDARLAAGSSATAMSYFAAGGSVGFFVAPALATPALDAWGSARPRCSSRRPCSWVSSCCVTSAASRAARPRRPPHPAGTGPAGSRSSRGSRSSGPRSRSASTRSWRCTGSTPSARPAPSAAPPSPCSSAAACWAPSPAGGSPTGSAWCAPSGSATSCSARRSRRCCCARTATPRCRWSCSSGWSRTSRSRCW